MMLMEKKIHLLIDELKQLNNELPLEEIKLIINHIKDPDNKSISTIVSELLYNPKIIPLIKTILKELEKK